MSIPWGGTTVGSWAAESERAEAEEHDALPPPPTLPTTTFPSLKESVSSKTKKKKMTLSEFNNSTPAAAPYGGRSTATRLTPEEMLQLPTAPKPRTDSDNFGGGGGGRLGGGFSSYGGGDDRRGPANRRGGGFDDERRGPRREVDFDVQPSRADEVDNWAAGKRAVHVMDSGRNIANNNISSNHSSRYGSLGGGSRADEVDNWNFGKKSSVGGGPPPRSNTFGSAFRDPVGDWKKEREVVSGRPRLVLDPKRGGGEEQPPVVVAKNNKPNPFGAARPREDVLAEKGLDWKKLDSEIEAKKTSSRPTSSQGSRPTSSHSNLSENVGLSGSELGVKPKPRVNPFGDAKPREVLLEEKGLDWRKIDLDLEHRRIDRPETEEEKALKEEIENLKKEVEKESSNDVPPEAGGEQISLRDLIQIKEKDLEVLIRELDDKVRFGQKAAERPSSGAGRLPIAERPPSQSGSINGSRVAEWMDRPRSRGRGDVWTRPGEERRGGFHGGGRERGFSSNRDFDRSRSREKW